MCRCICSGGGGEYFFRPLNLESVIGDFFHLSHIYNGTVFISLQLKCVASLYPDVSFHKLYIRSKYLLLCEPLDQVFHSLLTECMLLNFSF